MFLVKNLSSPNLFLAVRDVSDSTPGEGFVGAELVVGAVDVKTLSINSKKQLCVPLILLCNTKVVEM